MTVKPLASIPFVLREAYNRRMVWNIWRAVRAEWGKLGGGRDRFAAHVDDVVMSTRTSQRITLPDGSAYDIPTAPPTPKTIYNFVNSMAAAAGLDQTPPPIVAKPRATTETLQYLHLYLWRTNPQRVAQWDRYDERVRDDVPVGHLDDSFELIAPHVLMPTAYRLFEPSSKGASRAAAAIIKSADPLAFDFEGAGWTFRGVIAFKPAPNPDFSRFHVFDEVQWRHITGDDTPSSEPAAPERFRSDLQFVRGHAVGFKSKNYVHFDDRRPTIETEGYIFTAEVHSDLSTEKRYASTYISAPDLSLNWTKNRDIMDGLMSYTALRIDGLGRRGLYAPIEATAEQQITINNICEFIR